LPTATRYDVSMRGIFMLAAVLCAACTLTTSLDGYVGQEPLLEAPDAAREAGRAEGAADAAAEASLAITSLVLVNADTAQAVEPLTTGATIPSSLARWNVRAEVRGDAGSIQFDLDGRPANTEHRPPFYLCGDQEGGVNACSMSSGTHTLRATPYAQDDSLGPPGDATTITVMIP